MRYMISFTTALLAITSANVCLAANDPSLAPGVAGNFGEGTGAGDLIAAV